MATPSRIRRRIAATVVLACVTAASCNTAQVARRGPGYKYYVVGSPADVFRPTRGLWVAQGGGDDVDRNYVRMGEFSGGGDTGTILHLLGKT